MRRRWMRRLQLNGVRRLDSAKLHPCTTENAALARNCTVISFVLDRANGRERARQIAQVIERTVHDTSEVDAATRQKWQQTVGAVADGFAIRSRIER
jgi:hypothetical protein